MSDIRKSRVAYHVAGTPNLEILSQTSYTTKITPCVITYILHSSCNYIELSVYAHSRHQPVHSPAMASPSPANEYSIAERPARDEERSADRRRYRNSASRSRSRSSRRSRSRTRSPRLSRSRSASSHRSYRTPQETWARPDELHYKPALILRGHKRGVSGVKFSPDGKRIASCSADATIKIWDAETGRLEHTLEGHMAGISCIAWSPDSTILASGSDDKVIRLWDVVKVCRRYSR
jgi:COMPASS component SWD3